MKYLMLLLLFVTQSVFAVDVAKTVGKTGALFLTDDKCPFSDNPDLSYFYGVAHKTKETTIKGCWTEYDSLIVLLVPGQEPVAYEPKVFEWKIRKA